MSSRPLPNPSCEPACPTALEQAYSPEQFRLQGHALVDQLADYLAQALAGKLDAVLPAHAPDDLAKDWQRDFQSPHPMSLPVLMAEVLAQSNHLHHPRYIGHQVSAPLPITALCEMAAALLNNGTAIYEMGPVSTAMERNVIRWMSDHVGYGPEADGFLTSGGSAGNLTALLAARQAMAGYDLWEAGQKPEEPFAILASAHIHYSLQRVVQVMGWGKDAVIAVPLDENFRLDASQLQPAYDKAVAAGRRVIAVVGNACSTATGSYDPLEAIGAFCKEKGLWFHVDGAHGASALLSEKYRPLLSGIEQADSVVWDPHKMMMMPALVTAVLFKDGRDSYKAFAQKASYLFQKPPEEEWFNLAHRTLECTKRMMSLKLYAALSLYGEGVFAEHVTRMYDLAKDFAGLLLAQPDFELAVMPESNIVCFRYAPEGFSGDLSALQAEIRQRILKDGSFYLVQTQLPQGVFLRVTLMNSFTTLSDLEALLETIRQSSRTVS